MKQDFSNIELRSIFRIIKVIDDGLIVNLSWEWELDFSEE